MERRGKGAVRRRGGHHQQPHGAYRRHPGPVLPEGALRGELYSDSKYVIDALSKGWVYGWQKRGWIKSDKKPALNPDLWERLLALTDRHEMHYHWVKGHAENEKNNRCDQMAVAESKKFQ